ncbi:1424_t:CDS:2, partial [Funneliformis mosseae]
EAELPNLSSSPGIPNPSSSSLLREQVKTTNTNADDDDGDFISSNKSTISRTHWKDTSSSSLQSLESAGSNRGDTKMMDEVNNPGYNRQHTPPHQIYSTSENQNLLTIKEIKNFAIHGINQGGLNGKIYTMYYDADLQHHFVFETCQYRIGTTWGNIPESLSDTRNDLRNKLLLSFIPSGETYSFSKHYEVHWVHRFADKLSLFFEAPRNPLLDKNSEGWLNCHIFAPLIGDYIIFRVDDVEYFSAETYVDEDPQNSKPISYKHKLFREMKDQLDRLLKKLEFTKESIRGPNGKIYAMYYNIDLEYYFVYEMCRYRIGTTWSSVPDSLMTLKKILCLKQYYKQFLKII